MVGEKVVFGWFLGFVVVLCLSALLYMSRVFRGSFVSSLFCLFIKLLFYRLKKYINMLYVINKTYEFFLHSSMITWVSKPRD